MTNTGLLIMWCPGKGELHSYYFISFFKKLLLQNYWLLSFSTVAIMFYLYVCTFERELVSEEGIRRGKYLKRKCLKITSLSRCTLGFLRI